jgi:hypothetical protein
VSFHTCGDIALITLGECRVSVLSVAPVCLRAVERARHDLQVGSWSLASIAGALETDLVYRPAPDDVLGVLTVAERGAVAVLAEHVRGSPYQAIVTARLLAGVIGLRAEGAPLPTAQCIARDAFKHQRWRRPWWAAAFLLAVSQDDVYALIAGQQTAAEVGWLRGLPPEFVPWRITQEILCGGIEGDAYAALAETARHGRPFLDWLAAGRQKDCVR